jgi:hypothetical protein
MIGVFMDDIRVEFHRSSKGWTGEIFLGGKVVDSLFADNLGSLMFLIHGKLVSLEHVSAVTEELNITPVLWD